MAKSPKPPTLASLLRRTISSLSHAKAMQLIGTIIDHGTDEKSLKALLHADGLLDLLLTKPVPDRIACRCYYYRANILSARRHLANEWREWPWRSELIDGEILALRSAVAHAGFVNLHPLERAQIFTNLGNILNHVGRFVEAIEQWDRALAAVPKFAMACGNRGIGFGHYSNAVYDPGHQGVLLVAACESLAQALEKDAVLDSPDNGQALTQFGDHLTAIWRAVDVPDLTGLIDLHNHSIGRSKREREYRRWCLTNRLFISPLNDVGPYPIAAHDVMTLPSIRVGLDHGPGIPAVIRHFNLIKQEFCAARYALHEGLATSGVHFSDRGVLLYNTLDYPAFGFAVERMKMAFRGAYAVFDKVAFLLNHYLDLGHPERQVNFRNVWFAKGRGKALHPLLDGLKNWPLRGLFWLSKDVFEDDFKNVTEPDAAALYDLRNHMEHKFVAVHDSFLMSVSPFASDAPKPGVFDVSVRDLADKTLRQLKLARAAIVYLSLGVHAEEKRRAAESGSEGLVMPMILGTWNDRWKRQDW